MRKSTRAAFAGCGFGGQVSRCARFPALAVACCARRQLSDRTGLHGGYVTLGLPPGNSRNSHNWPRRQSTRHRVRRDLQHAGRLLQAEASEEPKLNDAALAFVHAREILERIVDGDQILPASFASASLSPNVTRIAPPPRF